MSEEKGSFAGQHPLERAFSDANEYTIARKDHDVTEPYSPQLDSELLDRVRNAFVLDKETIARTLHPDFNRYFRHLLHNTAAFDAYVDEVRYIARIGRFAGHVLDLAAGFGLTALCLRALGAAHVTCMDIVETKVSTARKFAALVQADGCSFRLGDAATIAAEDESFDGVLVKDAASHFRSPAKVYAEVARVLKPGRRLVILDDRNALNSRVQRATQRIWEVSETGSADELAQLGMQVSFTEMRRAYISRRFAGIDEERTRIIANQTRGYTFRMLDHVVPLLIEGKTISLEPVAQCVNPENEIVQERLIDPVGLATQLRQFGLDACVLPPAGWDPGTFRRSGGTSRGIWLRRLIRLIWPTQRIWPVAVKRMGDFVVAAIKR